MRRENVARKSCGVGPNRHPDVSPIQSETARPLPASKDKSRIKGKVIQTMRSTPFLVLGSAGILLGLQAVSFAQTQPGQAQTDNTGQKRETVAKPMTDKQRKKQEEKLRKELETPYKRWLNEEVGYIITDGERKAFIALNTD